MSITFNITQLERHLPDGVVIVAHWIATKKEGFTPFDNPDMSGGDYEYNASAYGSVGLPAKDPSDPTFVAYKDITEAQAIEWVKKTMGEEQIKTLEANLDAQIEAQKHPTQASGVPWYKDEPEDQL